MVVRLKVTSRVIYSPPHVRPVCVASLVLEGYFQVESVPLLYHVDRGFAWALSELTCPAYDSDSTAHFLA